MVSLHSHCSSFSHKHDSKGGKYQRPVEIKYTYRGGSEGLGQDNKRLELGLAERVQVQRQAPSSTTLVTELFFYIPDYILMGA